MADLKAFLDLADVAEPQSHEMLTIFPLIHGEPLPATYVTLDEALRRGVLHVMEASAGGSVPELRVVNEGDTPVLLLDGEELVGAKQNRTLNLSILVPPKTGLVVPVTCVEHGRWTPGAREFKASPSVHYAAGRAQKMAQVSRSLRTTARAHADQLQVWEAIDAKLGRMHAPSDTAAMEDAYRHHASSLEDYERAFAVLPGQSGAVFALGGAIRGAEAFDSPETLRKIFPKLVRSYALDALELRRAATVAPTREQARAFLDDLAAAPQESAPGIGWGRSVRIETPSLLGAALALEDHVVHLAAFLTAGQDRVEDPGTPLSRPTRRWHR